MSSGATPQSSEAPTAASSGNPFRTFYASLSDYIPVGSNERTNEEEAFFALSRWERFIGFLLCCAGAAICLAVSFLTVPLIAIRPAKFAVSFAMGNVLFILA
jgi:hypothetical protein